MFVNTLAIQNTVNERNSLREFIGELKQATLEAHKYGTIGGYPKIANVASVDYDKLAQKIPNTKIKFKCIDLLEAEKLYKNYQQDITKIINNI